MATVGFYAVVSVCLSLLCTSVLSGSNRRPLDQFVGHYEHIHYDSEELLHHHHRLKRSTTGENELKLSFSAFEREFNIVLYPDDHVFHKRASFKDSRGELSKTQMKSYLYAGHDINDPSIKVKGHLAFGVFDGRIKHGDEVYYIEPSNRYLNESVADSHSIIYRKSDVDMSKVFKDHPEATPCGATTRAQQRNLASLLQNQPHDTTPVSGRLTKRQSFDANRIRCHLNVVIDYKFYDALTSGDTVNLRRAQAISLVSNIIGDGSDNFERQDFNGDGNPDKIHFSVFNLEVETDRPMSGPFSNQFLGAEAYLNAHSEADYSEFCLSYRFTYRDFDQGVLGLAFVAATGSRGGLCDNVRNGFTFNTGIVTLLNFNARVNNVVAGLTFTHEAGHNFGSQHDEASARCQPSDSDGGKYVMFDRANDGSRRNNNNFSPCSIMMMISQIQTKGQNPDDECFLTAEDDCGNSVVDPGEACDCGLNYNTTTMLCKDDPCCNGTTCRLANQAECSPVQGDCCFENCTFISDAVTCRVEDDCALSQTCNGSSAVCPASEVRLSNSSIISCMTENNMTRFCQNGACVGSICIPLGLDDCECTEEVKQCHVCCMLASGVCESTITIADTNDTAKSLIPDGQGQVLDIGFPCNDFNGYCNFFNICQLINTDGAIKRLANIGGDAIQSIVSFFRDYWWAPIVGAVVLIIAMFLVVLGCHFLLPRPKHMKKRAERRKSIRQSRRGRNRIVSGYPDQGGYQQYPMRQQY